MLCKDSSGCTLLYEIMAFSIVGYCTTSIHLYSASRSTHQLKVLPLTRLGSASRGDFVVPHARTAIKQHRTFSIVGPSAWNSLPSESDLFHGICPARFTSSLKLLFSPGPGLGVPLSSYLEVALYKYRRQIDR